MNKKKPASQKAIAFNRKALHEYTLEERYEAGIVLQGWEVKSLRAGKAQIQDSYVLIKKGEAWLVNTHISPLLSASSHVRPEPTQTRKLLLHRRQLNTLIGLVERKGYTLIPLSLYWHQAKVKVEIALVKGKKEYDKRADEKDKDWKREQQKLFKKKI